MEHLASLEFGGFSINLRLTSHVCRHLLETPDLGVSSIPLPS